MRWASRELDRFLPAVVDAARAAVNARPHTPAVRIALISALEAAGDHSAALDAASAAAVGLPHSSEIQLILARLCAMFGRPAAGWQAWRRAANGSCLQPDRLMYAETLMSLTASRGNENGAELLELCDIVLSLKPGHTEATFLRACALARLGCNEEARAAMSLSRFVAIEDISAPPGFRDETSFREELRNEVFRNRTLCPDPPGKATIHGRQTAPLRADAGAAIAALVERVKERVDAFAVRHRGDEFAQEHPDTADLDVWGVVYDAQGKQRAHHHPGGWLSGVYFVSAARGASGAFDGSLLLGASEDDDITPPWETIRIEPKPGRLVMFPSYVPHATEPVEIGGERIVIAFDVVAS